MPDALRPLTARSVLLSLLLGNVPPRAPVARLVRTAELFGIAEGTTRTALSRMASAGELTSQDGWYQLASERLLARQRRQHQSRAAATRAWDGTGWVQAAVVADGRRAPAERARLRDELGRARLAELREGLWLRPDNLDIPAVAAPDVHWFTASPTGDPAALAGRLWDLDGWADAARTLVAQMDVLADQLDRHDHRVLAEGFVASAAVLRHFQADPLLPHELLPTDWPGPRLRERYDHYDAIYRTCIAELFRADA